MKKLYFLQKSKVKTKIQTERINIRLKTIDWTYCQTIFIINKSNERMK